MTVSNSAGKSKLKYDDIQDLILSEEVHRRDAGISNAQDQALVMENRGRNRGKRLDYRPNLMTGHSQEVDLSLKR